MYITFVYDLIIMKPKHYKYFKNFFNKLDAYIIHV